MNAELRNYILLKEYLNSEELGRLKCRSIGYDGCVYFLFFGNTYKAVKLTVDWNDGIIADKKIYDLGVHEIDPYFIQPIGDELLLVDARSEFSNIGAEKNAVIVGADGKIKNSLCLGDGIECCHVTSDERIVIAYFDEGIFGNNGWGEVDSPAPLGCAGLVVWDKNGCKLWEHDQSKFFVSDCNAMNISDDGRIYWLADKGSEYSLCVYDYDGRAFSNITSITSDSNSFLILDNGFVFGGDYTHRSYFKYLNKSGEWQSFKFFHDGKEIISEKYCFRGNKALIIDMHGRMFCSEIKV